MAECIEALCLYSNYKKDDRSIFSPSDSFKNYVDPSYFKIRGLNRYSSQQEQTDSFSWWLSDDLFRRKKAWIPCQLLFNSIFKNNEPIIRFERSSIGCAFGKKDDDRTTLASILELLEHDACMYSYLSAKPLVKIIKLPKILNDLKNYIESFGHELRVFDISAVTIVPVTVALLIDRSGKGQALTVGSASDIGWHNAIEKAILESIQSRSVRRDYLNRLEKAHNPSEPIHTPQQRMLYWSKLKNLEQWESQISYSKEVAFEDLPQMKTNLSDLIDDLRKNKIHVYVADISIRELFSTQFCVKKSVSPDLLNSYMNESYKSNYSNFHGDMTSPISLPPHPFV